MSIPAANKRQPFNIEICMGSDKPSTNSLESSNSNHLVSNIKYNWINQIRRQFEENAKEEEEEEVEVEEKLDESELKKYQKIIHELTEENKGLNLDFENMELSELDAEILKTEKEVQSLRSEINSNDKYDFQENKIESKQDAINRSYKKIDNLTKLTSALYNEICVWYKPIIQKKFHEDELKCQIDVANLIEDPDQIQQSVKANLKYVKKLAKKK
ncbi:hypothetical protein M9Y10_022322 [Tritrichomonas musculus]|uniref:Uncharacterized protein n=1 Tax=Tritrichomonas musculus TaxID=1915356 RepID=A0ABR2KS59_9EUKA